MSVQESVLNLFLKILFPQNYPTKTQKKQKKTQRGFHGDFGFLGF